MMTLTFPVCSDLAENESVNTQTQLMVRGQTMLLSLSGLGIMVCWCCTMLLQCVVSVSNIALQAQSIIKIQPGINHPLLLIIN